MKPQHTYFYWAARLIAAIILLQTLFYKFSGAPESVYIFSVVGIEPWGRYVLGVIELVTGILLLLPATVWIGAILALGSMTGAIVSHFTLLGIEVQGDGGKLFALACIVFACSIYLVIRDRKKIPVLNTLLP